MPLSRHQWCELVLTHSKRRTWRLFLFGFCRLLFLASVVFPPQTTAFYSFQIRKVISEPPKVIKMSSPVIQMILQLQTSRRQRWWHRTGPNSFLKCDLTLNSMRFLEQRKVIWTVNHSHTPHIYGLSVEPPERTEKQQHHGEVGGGGPSSSITPEMNSLQHILLVSSSLLLKCQTPTQASRSHCNPILTHRPVLAKLLCKTAPKWSSYTQYLQLSPCLKVEKGSWTLGDGDSDFNCLGILLNALIELLSNLSSLYYEDLKTVFFFLN